MEAKSTRASEDPVGREAMLTNWALEKNSRGATGVVVCPGSTPLGKTLNTGQQQQLLPLEIRPVEPAQASGSCAVLCSHMAASDNSANPNPFFFLLFHLTKHVWTPLVVKSCDG